MRQVIFLRNCGAKARAAAFSLAFAGIFSMGPTPGFGQVFQDASVMSLAAMRDRFRPVIVFYPERAGRPEGVAVRRQRELLQGHEAELKERDVVVVFVPVAGDGDQPSNRHLQGLRREFQVADREFTVVLVGKDGGEKFRSHAPVTIEKFNALIDAMPMRRQEVRNGHAN
jgi:molybdopterin converting factor small subunit